MAARASLAQVLKTEVVNHNGDHVPVEMKPGKVIGLYFSAHWCPPCRSFTPQLIDWYKKAAKEKHGDNFEIVFISFDRDEASFKSYYKDMPWLALSYDSDNRQPTGEQFGVSGIPCFILIEGTDEKVFNKGGREIVGSDKEANNFPWPASK